MILCGPKMSNKATKNHFDSGKDEVVSFQFFYFLQTKIHLLVIEIVNVTVNLSFGIEYKVKFSIALRKIENNLMGSVVSLNAEIS